MEEWLDSLDRMPWPIRWLGLIAFACMCFIPIAIMGSIVVGFLMAFFGGGR